MPIAELTVAGYRSIRQLRLPLRRINVLTGPNGCGKSNLYNAIFLLAKAASGGFARAIAEEGGMSSVLWAGVQKRLTSKKPPQRVALAVTTDPYSYELQCGLPQGGPFPGDPQVKKELVWFRDDRARPVMLLEREGASATLRDREGRMVQYPIQLYLSESILSQIQEPHVYPELSALRGEMRRWRFYHHFRTDPHSPLRRPQIGVFTPVLSHDGSDLAAAIQTIVEISDVDALRAAIDHAFPGARLEIQQERTGFSVSLQTPGILRPLEAPELSDGTLRYLCLVAALLSPRPPALLALNEPETSIHPDLIPPLAKLIANASSESQIWITTHSRALAEEIERFSGEPQVRLTMVAGETCMATSPE